MDEAGPRAEEMRPRAPAAGTAPALAIDARAVVKVYRTRQGPKRALNGINLEVPRGTIFGLLGPNGAGKSTFINILAGLVIKTSGRIATWGHDLDAEPRQTRAVIGVVPQELNIDTFFTPRQILEFQAGLYGVPGPERRTQEILAAMHLSEVAEAYSRTLSGGMRRRLLIAKAMVHDPPILVLDEPTAGVDVELRRELWDYVRALNGRGITVVLTTHYLEEAQELCERIAILNRGDVVACDDTDALIARLDRKELTIVLAEDAAGVPEALACYEVQFQPPRRFVIRYRPSRTRILEILDAVQAAGLPIADLTTEESDLEDIFLDVTRPGEDD